MEILTADELARALKIKKPTVRKWTREGIPVIRCGRLVRFQLDAVLAWLHQRDADAGKDA